MASHIWFTGFIGAATLLTSSVATAACRAQTRAPAAAPAPVSSTKQAEKLFAKVIQAEKAGAARSATRPTEARASYRTAMELMMQYRRLYANRPGTAVYVRATYRIGLYAELAGLAGTARDAFLACARELEKPAPGSNPEKPQKLKEVVPWDDRLLSELVQERLAVASVPTGQATFTKVLR